MNENEKLPCHRCWNEHGSKDECVEHCQRLENYQYNKPWYHIPPYGMEQKEEVTIHAPINDVKKCLIIGCNNVGNRRGLCHIKHYDAWRKGMMPHPVEGSFKPNRKTRPKKAKKTRKHGISDEALRNVEQNLRAAVERIEARKEILDEEAARVIAIDFNNYPELYEMLLKLNGCSRLPLGHTLVNLISIGLQSCESAKKGGKQCNTT